VFVISACAATYSPPKAAAPDVSQVISGTKEQLLSVAEQVLLAEGLEIADTNTETGIILTSATLTTVLPEAADCGSSFGINYLKDPRTMPRVSYEITVSDNSVGVRLIISAEYRSGCEVSVAALPCSMTNLQLTCVLKGNLESQLLAKMKSASIAQQFPK
jgi:hypothetical protein